MKKILAGVLAAVSMLTVAASAFADDKNVTAAGELEYDVEVTAPKVVLNLVMPAKMAAALNPYGAEIKLDADGTNKSTKGIASTAYKITNKSLDYGVYIDATAITTIVTTDKPNADKSPAWNVKGTSVTDGTKGACLALLGVNNVTGNPVAAVSAAAKSNAQGSLLLDSTVVANKETGVAAGQTSQAKMVYLAAATKSGDTVTETDAYLVFAGDLAKSSAAKEVVWNEDDAINVSLVLKVNPGPKTFA